MTLPLTLWLSTTHRHGGRAHTFATATVTNSVTHVAVPDGTVVTWSHDMAPGNVTFATTVGSTQTDTATSTTTGGVATIFVYAGTHATGTGTRTNIIATAPDGATGFDQLKLLASSFSHALAFTPASVPVNGDSTATATLVDGDGNPVPGEAVTFANDGSTGSPTFATPNAITDANGVATSAAHAGSSTGTKSTSATDAAADAAADSNVGGLTSTAGLVQTVAGQTNSSFVTAAYNTMFGHNPDAAGLAYWTSQLDSHTITRNAFAIGLAASPEYRNRVISGNGVLDFYHLYLHRAGDQGGITYWVNRMSGIGGTKLSFEQVRLMFVGSPEFFNTTSGGSPSTAIDNLYQMLLNRPADAAGKTYWMANYNTNTISAQFLFSSEGRAFLVNTVYNQILTRSAEPAGLSFWTNLLLSNGSDENIIGQILGSDEYFLSH